MFKRNKRNKGAEPPVVFPPVPVWQPSFKQPLDRMIDRMKYYTDRKRDFAVFENGTCVILEDGLSGIYSLVEE